MKKFDLLHTTILIVAILAGYSALTFLFYLLGSVTYIGNSGYLHGRSSETMLYELLMCVLYSVACIILVRNGRKYASLLLNDEPEFDGEEIAHLRLERRDILLAVFVGLGLYGLILYLPSVIIGLFELFRNKVSFDLLKGEGPDKESLALEALRVTIGALLIYAAPALTDFILKNTADRAVGSTPK